MAQILASAETNVRLGELAAEIKEADPLHRDVSREQVIRVLIAEHDRNAREEAGA
jgi:hypothetical protein